MAVNQHICQIITACVFLLFFSGCNFFGLELAGGNNEAQGLDDEPEVEPALSWEITLTKVLVDKAEEDRTMLGIPLDDGDEPYFVVIGLQSTPGVSGSTTDRPIVNNYRDKGWAGHLRDGQQKNIPLSMGRLRFDAVRKGDIIGVVVLAFEADLTPWAMIDDRVSVLANNLRNIFVDTIENRSPQNRLTRAFVSDLHTSMQSATVLFTDSSGPTQSLERRLYSLSDIDDLIGVNTMVFMAGDGPENMRLPSYQGYLLTDMLNTKGNDYRFYQNALVFDDNERDARYFVEMRIRAF